MDISYESRKKVMRMEKKRPLGREGRRDPRAECKGTGESTDGGGLEGGTGCF